MALLSEVDIVSALERLGQLAFAQGHTLQLVVVGGAAMHGRLPMTLMSFFFRHQSRASSGYMPKQWRMSMVGLRTGLTMQLQVI